MLATVAGSGQLTMRPLTRTLSLLVRELVKPRRARRTNRPRDAFSVVAPRDLAKRLAEVRALRELVRIKEEEFRAAVAR